MPSGTNFQDDINEWRLSKADRHFKEYQEIMDPVEVQITQEILGYFSSLPFFLLVAMIIVGWRFPIRKK